jgi:pimeloyl-ACP methyl ester carboxylesterase
MIHECHSEFVQRPGVNLEVYVQGRGPGLIVLPSYGRDGGADFDRFASRVSTAGFLVLRPQPRGIAGSVGVMDGVTVHDLADDVAMVIRELRVGKAIVLGHAFGNGVARILAVDHPSLVLGVILAAAQCSAVPPDIAKTPHQACDLAAPEETRLDALRRGFFAPTHDPRVWLEGWYPQTMQMQVNSAASVRAAEYWGAGAAPVLEIIPEYDPFKPKSHWQELRRQLGDRVTAEIVPDASHALFPEQPEKVADVVIGWCQHLLS